MIEKLFEELSQLEQVEAIALGGSRAGKEYDEKSDYDVYLYCTGAVDENVRRGILEKYCKYMEIDNHFWEQEDNCTLNDGIDIDILYRNLDDFVQDVASVVESYQPHNGYTTCMWHNLKNCKIVYDQNSRLGEAKKRFDVPYPKQLKKNIIDRNIKLLYEFMPAYKWQIAKAVERKDLVSISHRTAAFMESYFDVIWALNELTHPGEKRLVSLCKKMCKHLPADFEENINKLYEDLFTNLDAVNEDVDVIIEELKKVLQFERKESGMLLTEFDENKRAVINPDIMFHKIDGFPETLVSIFSHQLFHAIVDFLGGVEIAETHDVDGEWPVYEVRYKGKRFALYKARLGAPACVGCFEDVIPMGIKRIILLGNCGVLDKNIKDCGIIIPRKAIRDEGTSYHYAPASDYIDVNKKYVDEFKAVLEKYGYPYVEGTTWTTDAFYRETEKKIAMRKEMGAICVEMECAAMQAMCDFRGVEFFQFLYAGDNLDHSEWDPRSLSGNARLDDKQKIGLLAFELACRIEE